MSAHVDLGAKPSRFSLIVDGNEVEAQPGDTVASALLRAGIRTLHRSVSGSPRGIFCGIGSCYDCYSTIDGRFYQRTCMTLVQPGMRVETST